MVDGGATTAGHLYVKMLKKIVPSSMCAILYPSDPDAVIPPGNSLGEFDGVAWTGCSLTVYDDSPEVRNQISLCRSVFDAKVPSFGSCWAAQIAAVAAGGICGANPNGREMGIARKIELTPEGRAHPMYEGKSKVFDAFISHVDEITHLPPGAVNLAGNSFTKIQAISVVYNGGVFWGLQYHPEIPYDYMIKLIKHRSKGMIEKNVFKNQDKINQHVNFIEKAKLELSDDLRTIELKNWLNYLKN